MGGGGGEIIKLLLAKMLMGRYNILLMDEPSNFLDIPSLEALEILMKVSSHLGPSCVPQYILAPLSRI